MKDTKAFPEGGVWDVLRSDEVFNDFLRDDYEEASATSNKVAMGLNIAQHLRKLTDCVSLIDAEIHNQVWEEEVRLFGSGSAMYFSF